MTPQPRRSMPASARPNAALRKGRESRNVRHMPEKPQKPGMFAAVDWQKLRFKGAAALFIVLWFTLWGRAFYVQLIMGPELALKAERQHTSTELVEARRGTIFDRNGQVLARSVECRSVYANPRTVADINHVARVLSPLLHLSEQTLRDQLSLNRSFIWLARKVDDATAKAVQDAALDGIGLSREYDRVYPFKQMAGHLLGFVGLDNKGLEGLERSYDQMLAGADQRNVVQRDASGRGFYQADALAAHGQDVYLTLDVQIQYIAEDVIQEAVTQAKAKWGGIMVADVATGEVLAWAQYPFFNPNNFRKSTPDQYRNRLAADAVEPGSTFKPFLMAAALEEGIIKKDTEFFCENGRWQTRNITIRDDNRAYGNLSADKILRYSSNIGMAKIAQAAGAATYHSYLSRLGFGSRTSIGVGENRGILRNPKDWNEADLLAAGFGQSIAVTGVQMTQAYLTLANGGLFKPIHVVMDTENTLSGAEQRIFSKKTADAVLRMMEEVVDGDGTGSNARIPGVKVAGKTGTAQKAHKGGGNTGYGDERMASFAGVVPADQPRYVIWAMLDEPEGAVRYGGRLAAPAFQKVASRTLAYGGYLPDVIFNTAPKETALAQNDPKAKPAPKNDQKNKNDAKNKPAAGKDDKNSKKNVNDKEQAGLLALAPDVTGKSVRRAMEMFAKDGIVPEVRGQGLVVAQQQPQAGQPYEVNGQPTPCVIWLE